MNTGKKIRLCIIFFVVILIGMLVPITDTDGEKESMITTTEQYTVDNISEYITEESSIEATSEAVSEIADTEEVSTAEITTEEVSIQVFNPNKWDREYALSDSLEKELDVMIEAMTIEEKVGQLFFIKNDGRFDESVLEEYPVGGIILFSGDFVGETPDSLRAELEAFQNTSKLPLLIGVDEEGGSVVRLSNFSNLVSTPFSSPRSLYSQGGFQLVKEDAVNKSQILLSYGINVNFAPVCDLSFNYGEFMYNRAFGVNVEETCTYVDMVVSAMNENKMGSVLKHFPGYGGNGDTHRAIVRDERSYQQFQNEDFLPFKAGIEAEAQCILVSHNIVMSMDEDWPASMSPEIHRILREDLNFGGVIITDDLMMKGVSEYISLEDAAVQAVLAGNDMILSTDYAIQYNAVLQAVQDGRITEERLEESIVRVLRWKYKLGLLDI